MLNFLGKALTATILNGIALGAVGWVAWDASERGFPGSMLPDSAASASREEFSERSSVSIDDIANAHLFGREQRRAAPVVERAAPATRLDLKLAGVIARSTEGVGLALIGVGRGQQQVVRVGEAIGTTGALLSEVRRDHVLIERNGRLEKLSIERPELESRAPVSPGASSPGGFSDRLDDDLANLPMPSPVTVEGFDTTRTVEDAGSSTIPPQEEDADMTPPAEDGDDPRPAGVTTLPF